MKIFKNKKDIVYKENYDQHETLVKRNGEIILKYTDYVPTDFETLCDYIKKYPSKFVEIMDGITIVLRIDKRKSIMFHKTLFDKVVDISVISGSLRFQEFMTIPINIAYSIICQYK